MSTEYKVFKQCLSSSKLSINVSDGDSDDDDDMSRGGPSRKFWGRGS